ncbi:MAG: hypothetical protein AABX59_04160, partial [Nanoarchaeota archaeon]
MKRVAVKLLLFIVVLIPYILTLIIVNAQELEWERTFGGSSNDLGYDVQQTSGEGFIIVGSVNLSGNQDVYLLKTDSLGNKLWEKNLIGRRGFSDYGHSVQQTKDEGYIIAGACDYGYIGGYDLSDICLFKTDSLGNMQWRLIYGDDVYNEWASSVQQISDGGYIATGPDYLEYGVFLIKTNSSGNLLWKRNFGGTTGYEIGYSVQQTSDGGYIISGATTSFGAINEDVYLIKTDSLGNKLWEKTFGGNGYDSGNSVQQTSDGGYVIAGRTSSLGSGSYDFYLIKTDSQGNKQWEKVFGGSGSDSASSIKQISDGGYILAGWTSSFGMGSFDFYLIKTDSSGNKLWEKTFGGINSDFSRSVGLTKDGGYIVAGTTSSFGSGGSDVYLIKVREGGGGVSGVSKCMSVKLNGPTKNKIDVVFVGSGFENMGQFSAVVNEMIDYNDAGFLGLMSVEPFKTYRDRFNFWYVNSPLEFTSDNFAQSPKIARSSCPFADQIILLSVEPRFHSYAILNGGVAYVTIGCEYIGKCEWPLEVYSQVLNKNVNLGDNKKDVIRAVVHEFGHSFGGLFDEYNYGYFSPHLEEPDEIPNCDSIFCDKWDGEEGCFLICGYSNWNRGFDNTLMRNLYGPIYEDFKAINEDEL